MSETKFCPECGYSMNMEERFCPECGATVDVPQTKEAANAAPAANEGAPEPAVIGAGSRANIMGSVNTTSTDMSQTTNNNMSQTTTNTNIQTSSVDNSSVVNNTTIVMEGKKTPEFCEVCGSPFEGKHARCPKCGKLICFDCKVKGKNRCVECEKKAVNEYRMAFQQLLLTTNGNIGAAGRQMMNQKARDLDVENVKASIEKELMEEYKPVARAEQPTVVPNTTRTTDTTASEPAATAKGGVVDNRTPLRPKSDNGGGGGSSKWPILVVLLIVIGAGAYFLLGKGDATKEQTATETVTEQPAVQAAPSKPAAAPTVQATPQPAAQPAAQPAQTVSAPKAQPAQAAKPVEPKRDTNYEAGMAAYNKGEGLEAISKFKASGSAEANYMLGVIYEKGCGNVAANAMMARSFFKKAANQGHAEAKAKL